MSATLKVSMEFLDGFFLIYCRVSADPKQRLASVPEQEAEGRLNAKEHGVPDNRILVVSDQAVSASEYRQGAPREGWPEVLRLLESGTVSRLYIWESSRGVRTLDDHVVLRKALRDNGILWHYGDAVYDMSNGDHRRIAATDAINDEDSSYKTSKRVKRSLRASAAKGMPHAHRPFGYERIYSQDNGKLLGQRPHPTESLVVIEAAERFAKGESVGAIIADFTARDVPNKGTAWTPKAIKDTLTSPAQNGYRSFNGTLIPAQWEANIGDELFALCATRFADPTRLVTRDNEANGNKPVHLLSYIARCGICLSPMRHALSRHGKGVYRCTGKSSHQLSRNQYGMDRQVSEAMINRLETADPYSPNAELEAPSAIALEIEALKGEKAAELQARKDGFLSLADYISLEQDRNAKIAALQKAQVKAVPLPEAVVSLFGAGARERWESADTDISTKRAAVRYLFAVTVLPAAAGNAYDPERCVVEPIDP